MTSVLLAGCGKMGGALLSRWAVAMPDVSFTVVEPYGTDITGDNITVYKNLSALPAGFRADIVVFAVKPQSLGGMIDGYKTFADTGALFISIAAGVTTAFFEKNLGRGVKIVRAMPNTPAAIGAGMTAAYANGNVNADERNTAEKLLSAAGLFLWVDNEEQLNPVTALSGSGPAYVFLLIEVMAAAGVKCGLAPDTAMQLARQTVIGSAQLAASDPQTPASTLRENVTSPNGTTAAALSVLMDEKTGIQPVFDEALKSATDRARELAAG